MAAVTSTPDPVQGCVVDRLGAMRYRAVATPDFVARWFHEGAEAASVATAPTMDFDRNDDLQNKFIARLTRRPVTPPRQDRNSTRLDSRHECASSRPSSA